MFAIMIPSHHPYSLIPARRLGPITSYQIPILLPSFIIGIPQVKVGDTVILQNRRIDTGLEVARYNASMEAFTRMFRIRFDRLLVLNSSRTVVPLIANAPRPSLFRPAVSCKAWLSSIRCSPRKNGSHYKCSASEVIQHSHSLCNHGPNPCAFHCKRHETNP
jgi:hypothetical protein